MTYVIYLFLEIKSLSVNDSSSSSFLDFSYYFWISSYTSASCSASSSNIILLPYTLVTNSTQSLAKNLPGSAMTIKSFIYSLAFSHANSTTSPIYLKSTFGISSCPFKCKRAFSVINPPPISIIFGEKPCYSASLQSLTHSSIDFS